jgi:hypothetical protein
VTEVRYRSLDTDTLVVGNGNVFSLVRVVLLDRRAQEKRVEYYYGNGLKA